MVINGRILWEMAPIKGMLRFKERNHGVSHGLGEAGYDICLKQHIHFCPETDGMRVTKATKRPDGTIFIDEHKKGRFILASAIEEFNMPNDVVGIVHDKSTWARCGLSVFNTVIEPGWKGFLTLELVYHGDEELILPAGAGIAQVLFHSLAEPAIYDGKYQNQEDKPIPARRR